MKKFLNISVIAALATLPLAANATYTQEEIKTADATTVATTGYVKGAYNALNTSKQDKLTDDQLQAIEDVTDLNTDVSALKTAVGDSTSGLVKDVADLETAVGDSTSGLVKDVADLRAAKADQSTTYTKTEVNDFLDNKANSADVYAKTETYTQTEVNTAIQGSANTAAYSNETNYTDGTVGAAIKALESVSGDYATKTGVAATVDAATGSVDNVSLTVTGTSAGSVSSTFTGDNVNIPTSATVPTLTTWGNDNSNSTATVTLTTTATQVSGTIRSTFTGGAITGGTATGSIENIDVSVSGYTAQ